MNIKRHLAVLLLLGSLIGLAGIMFGTNPEHVPPYVSIAIFVLLYGVLVAVVFFVFKLVRFLGAFRWTESQMWRYALIAASLPVVLLLLQSIGQLTVRDVLLAVIFFIIVVLYVRRSRQTNTPAK